MMQPFNPGNEAAILNGSPYYQAPAQVRKMQADLATLPRWYADSEEDRWWAITPQTPGWKDIYRTLSSRKTAHDILSQLQPQLVPTLFTTIEEIAALRLHSQDTLLVKSPFSSSGRGLVWLPPGPIARSERQLMSGMLKKQGSVSIERALNKCLDFSMHFDVISPEVTEFIGYSVFQTSQKGAYEKSMLANQDSLESLITAYIHSEVLHEVQTQLTQLLHTTYAPHYTGKMGVDMLLYKEREQVHLHPCIEINMRKTMGYVALQLHKKHLCPSSTGEYFVDYQSAPGAVLHKHRELEATYPLVREGGLIESGYFSLCPVTEQTQYHAYAIISAF
jgi:hypothetical protein